MTKPARNRSAKRRPRRGADPGTCAASGPPGTVSGTVAGEALVNPRRSVGEPDSRSEAPSSRVRLLTLREAGAYLGISTWTLRELIWRGTLPAVRITQKIHLDLRDLDVFIERSKERVGGDGPNG